MTSRRDRVVRAGTSPGATMPEHRSRSVHLGQPAGGDSFTMCVTISPRRTRDIRAMSSSV